MPSGASMSMPVRSVSVPNRGWVWRPKLRHDPALGRPGSWPRSRPSPTAAPGRRRGGVARATARWAGGRRARLRTSASSRRVGLAQLPRQSLVRRPVLPHLREQGAPPLRLRRDLRPLRVHGAPELDQLAARPLGGLLARRQAVGGRVVSREPVQIVAGDPGEVRDRALAGQRRRAGGPGGAAGAAASRASVLEPRRERGLLARRDPRPRAPGGPRGRELGLDLDDAAVELLERARASWPGSGRSPPARRGARSRGAAPPRRARAPRRAGGAPRRAPPAWPSGSGGRSDGGAAPAPGRATPAGRGRTRGRGRPRGRGGRPHRAGPVRRGRPRARRPARAPRRRRSAPPASGTAGAAAGRAPAPRGASVPVQGAPGSEARSSSASPRSEPSVASPTAWRTSGAASRRSGTPTRRRTRTSSAPARRAAAVAPAAAARAASPRTAASARPPRRSPRRSRSRGSTHPWAACTSLTPGSRSSASTSAWSSGGVQRRGGSHLEPGGQGVRGKPVEPIPPGAEKPPELGQRHGGRDVPDRPPPRAGPALAPTTPVRPLRPGPGVPEHGHEPELARHAASDTGEREVSGQRRARAQHGQGREQHRRRGAAPPRRQPRSVAPTT